MQASVQIFAEIFDLGLVDLTIGDDPMNDTDDLRDLSVVDPLATEYIRQFRMFHRIPPVQPT